MTETAQTIETGSIDRRDFLYVATGAMAVVGAASVIWPLIDQMEPDAATLAAVAPFDVDLSSLAVGQQMTVKWRGQPIFIINRTPEQLQILQSAVDTKLLSDANSQVVQQPDYTQNWHRSIKPEYAIFIGVCTHLGCIPLFEPVKDQQSPGWLGGWFCPCHGSKYDLAGRVFSGVPAPYNLPVPPHSFISDRVVRIGENPRGKNFEMSSIVQL